MPTSLATRRTLRAVAVAAAASLALPAVAAAHARVSPPVSLSGQLQYFTLAVPTEKDNLTTAKIVFTVPAGFGIDSFGPPPPGWTQQVQQSGSGTSAVITKVTWTGGRTPTGQDSVFGFLAQPSKAQSYTFGVQQTYSDGSIVDWSGAESSDHPAPTISAASSLAGGGGSSTVAVLALIVAVLALLAGGAALAGRRAGGRPLA